MDESFYPKDELEKRRQIEELQQRWELDKRNENFVRDGFYPYYFHQPVRVLFIGRESYGMGGCDYLLTHYEVYRGDLSFNRRAFHRRIFYMLHAVLEGYEKWDEVPTAHDYARDFASDRHVSFAFMNISKISNETNKTATQWGVLRSFVERSSREIRQEIELLDPELIITANLTLCDILDEIKVVHCAEDNVLDVHTAKLNGRIIPIFNTYHWSYPGVKDRRAFYECIRDAWRKFGKESQKSPCLPGTKC